MEGGTTNMPSEIPARNEFAALFREAFRYLEQEVDLPPRGPLLTTFYESVLQPWGRSCGYWDVFVNFYALWDFRDRWFVLYVESHRGSRPPNGEEPVVTVPIDWILDVVNPGWRTDWPEVAKDDGMELVKLYAEAIKPYAREIFIPAVRPSDGLEGFSWYPPIAERLRQSKGNVR